jgi:phospholipase C
MKSGRFWIRISVYAVSVAVLAVVMVVFGGSTQSVRAASRAQPSSAIKHVVVIMQENHSFDNVLGRFCAEVTSGQISRGGYASGCDGVTTGRTSTGDTVALSSGPDVVPALAHSLKDQVVGIDGGKMDGFDLLPTCVGSLPTCYNQYDPLSGPCTAGSCVPNVSALAARYAISDRTFELYQSPSWEGHLYLVTANQDGFTGYNPRPNPLGPFPVAYGGGWGCDSGNVSQWMGATGPPTVIPSCVPTLSGSLGPNWANYSGPTASYVPTILDDLDAHQLSWKIYGGAGAPGIGDNEPFQPSGWQWTICPTFAECLYSGQHNNLVPAANIVTDAASGQIPSFSIVTPTAENSQHNGYSMSQGDNYIGQVVSALQSGPDWSSTAVFITWDDCGCFYDHVNPLSFNSQWGVRIPMVIVSPYAKPGYTDPNPTTFAGILKFVETNYGLPALNSTDATAYGYGFSFCFKASESGCVPAGLAKTRMTTQKVAPPTPSQVEDQKAEADDGT